MVVTNVQMTKPVPPGQKASPNGQSPQSPSINENGTVKTQRRRGSGRTDSQNQSKLRRKIPIAMDRQYEKQFQGTLHPFRKSYMGSSAESDRNS